MTSKETPTASKYEASTPSGGRRVQVDVAGVHIDVVRRYEVVDDISAAIAARRRFRVYFVNPHTVNLACANDGFRAILNRAERACADGIGVVWAGRLLSGMTLEQVSTDLLAPGLFSRASAAGWGVFLLGATTDVCEQAAANLAHQYPGLRVVGCYSPPFTAIEQMNNDDIARRVNAAHPEILLVAMGNLKQEPWIDANAGRLDVPVILTAGGYLDYVAGNVKYAPNWCHRLNVVWVFRLVQEPRRLWKRYLLGIPLFLGHVAGSWFRSRTAA